jgi:hypothetical protein
MYETQTLLRRQIRVRYPAGHGRMVLRTELDWDRDLEPVAVSDDGETSTFALETKKPFLHFKPCLESGGDVLWAVGPNLLALMTIEGTTDVFPYFEGSETGSFSPVLERDSAILGRKHLARVYLRPATTRTPSGAIRSSTCRTARTSSSPRRRSSAANGKWTRPSTSSTP